MTQTNMISLNKHMQLIQQIIHSTNWTNIQVFLENNVALYEKLCCYT